MDVQGTRYHMLFGRDDWVARITGEPAPLEFDERHKALRLTRHAPAFEQQVQRDPVGQQFRRGAGRDRYGNWYWIADDERSIRFLPVGKRHSVDWWHTTDLAPSCEAPSATGGFVECSPPPPPEFVLRGLAVTDHHYVVVGFEGPAFHGLLLFDLHAGGAPLVLTWPAATPFSPYDIAALPDCGVAVLDRANKTWWRIDRGFRLITSVETEAPAFVPVGEEPATPTTVGKTPVARPLAETGDPISIEAGPDDNVLVLDQAAVWVYGAAGLVDRLPLPNGVAVHDMTFVDPVVYVAHADGNQATAFHIDSAQHQLVAQPDYLPMRRWQAKALVAAGGSVFYDFADRWVPLQVFAECVYDREAVFTTPTDFNPAVPGMPFDSGRPGCVWHRLMLDLSLPHGAEIAIRARACDDPDLLPQVAWVKQPTPYLRGAGCELPWVDPWPDASTLGLAADRTGTWELLFQQVTGRYAEIEVTLRGSGRTSPALRALRAWYPRFSYVEHYLPSVYDEDQGAARFSERFLANFEGLLTNLEDHIEAVDALFDPTTAPADVLDWLASWFGLTLEPQWEEARRRFFLSHADRMFRQRGTVRGVVSALRLFLDAHLDESLFEPARVGPTGSKVRIVEHFKDAAHRFTVLVPHIESSDREAMVQRIVELAKPAHTGFELKRFWALFRVGEARLGLDTELGDGVAFEPTLLGQSALADGYLQPTHPFDVADRVVIDRDRVGGLPAL